MREAKKTFEKRLEKEVKRNPRAFYSYLRSKTTLKDGVMRLRKDDGSITNSDQESCSLLNEKYHSVFVSEPDGPVPVTRYNFQGPTLNDIVFTVDEVKKLLDELKEYSAPGPCEVLAKVLKMCSASLALPIFIILQRSFDSAILPVNWKRGNITSCF